MTTPVHVVGIGLDGAEGLSPHVQRIVHQATLLVGSDRHLSYFPHHPAQRLPLGNFQAALNVIQEKLPPLDDSLSEHDSLSERSPQLSSGPLPNPSVIVFLVSGDPLFFGLGRLLLHHLPPEQLTFHPHLSSIQLAFNRIKQPWQEATLISLHGREMDALIPALKKGATPIALLTDNNHSPHAIAHLIQSLDITTRYHLWICENLGGNDERVRKFTIEDFIQQEPEFSFDPLNVVILIQ
ncbi:MAG: precorrin-6y C5,15-methyltransferase (decarboxylating) subunit CbiE, partial [Merismopedia sp. SIO2A8]|nr:precorrin-6y C5,15-methyltransferase (decarboxylating) subunit CbiE [Merismopedia sp. SIO2A8]